MKQAATAGEETKGDPAPPPTTQQQQHEEKAGETSNLRSKLVKAISRTSNTSPDTSAHSLNSQHNEGAAGSGSVSGSGGGSGHGSGSGGGSGHGALGLGSGHGSGSGGGSGHGTVGRRLSLLSATSAGSRHGPGGSRHGSEAAPAPIPENGEVLGWSPDLDRGEGGSGSGSGGGGSPPGLLGEFGKHLSLAINGTFGSEGGSTSDTAEGAMPPPPPVPAKRHSDSAVPSATALGVAGGEPAGGAWLFVDRLAVGQSDMWWC